MIHIVSYDIESDRVRTKLSKLLEGYGVRVQYSVFECQLTDKRFQKLYKEVFKLVDGKSEGSVRFYRLCGSCEEKIVTIGKVLNNIEKMKEDVIVI